jgi:citrate lyase beta subunit
MFESHFFIPADKPKFIDKLSTLKCHYVIFDMEDSVHFNKLDICVDNLSIVNVKENFSVRFPFDFENINSCEQPISRLYNLGFRNFTIPKIETIVQFKNLLSFFEERSFDDVKFNIYIETPLALINLRAIIESFKDNIENILLGSHDFCNAMGSKHVNENLLYLRQRILTLGKAFGIKVVDIVNPEIYDSEYLKNQCIVSFNMGFDGKALIHPTQLEAFNTALYFTEEEYKNALEVEKELSKLGPDKFSIIKINGKIYEKPHIKRIFDILNWNKKGGYYDL